VPPRNDGQSRRLRRHDPDGRRRHQTVLFCSITAFVCLCCHVCEEYSSRDTRLAFLSTVYYSTRFTASPNIVSQLLSSSHTALHTLTNIQTNRQTDHQPIQRYIYRFLGLLEASRIIRTVLEPSGTFESFPGLPKTSATGHWASCRHRNIPQDHTLHYMTLHSSTASPVAWLTSPRQQLRLMRKYRHLTLAINQKYISK